MGLSLSKTSVGSSQWTCRLRYGSSRLRRPRWVARGATSAEHHPSWVWRQLEMPWAASWPTTQAGSLHPQETRLLEAPLGKAPFPQGVPLGQSWEGWAERMHCLGRRLQDGGYKVAVILGSWCIKRHTVHRASSRKTRQRKKKMGSGFS